MIRRAVLRKGGAVLAATVGLAVAAAGCASDSDDSAAPSPAANPAGAQAGTVTVFAASSLTAVFTDLGKKFDAEHPGSHVKFSFAGSSQLVAQLKAGAPADVLASADIPTMQNAIDAGRVTEAPVTFAQNILTIVTAAGNPKHITGLADLAKPNVKVVVCAPQVPCGAATRKLEINAGVTVKPVSEEPNVAAALQKVASGEADAGIVYVTDAKRAGAEVATVPLREAARAVNTYPIAVVADSRNAQLAHEFVALVTGPDGKQALAAAGFTLPSR